MILDIAFLFGMRSNCRRMKANQIIAVSLSTEPNPNVICSQKREKTFLWRTARRSSRPFWRNIELNIICTVHSGTVRNSKCKLHTYTSWSVIPGSPAPPLVTGKLWKIEISEEQITLAGDPILSRNIIFKVHTYSSYLISKWFSERRCYFSTLEYQQNGSPCFAWIYLGQQKIAGDFDGQRTYCAKYDRLAGGDEVFCDQLHYAAVQEEDDDEVPFTFRHPYHFPLQKHRDLGINQN